MKTQLWNRAGVAPAGSEILTATATVARPFVWCGDLESEKQGVKILGPVGFRVISVGDTLGERRLFVQQNFAHRESVVCMDSVVVLRFGSRELHFAGVSSKVVSVF